MEKKPLKQLPVGIQTFEKIIANDMLYIDKTEYIWNMIHLSNYIFLSRPRRFGKSLLISTIKSYFEGRKDLFKGLFIESVEKEWTTILCCTLAWHRASTWRKSSWSAICSIS